MSPGLKTAGDIFLADYRRRQSFADRYVKLCYNNC